MKRVGCDRNDTPHYREESTDEVCINYVAQPCHKGTVMAMTLGTTDADVVANVK
jgi:hypothetical protein